MSTNDSVLNVNVRGVDGLSPALNQIESKIIRFVGAVSSALTAIRVIGFPVQAIREFEVQMANVQKTTGFTDGQIKSLSESLIVMSRNINVSANDLGAIAAAAGQQGLGREGVEGIRQFTESVSRMAAVLDLTAEDAGTNIGKISSVFKIGLKDVEKVVSSFNEVSNNSTATGTQLLDIVKRIGDAAGSLNLQQAIGLAATGIDVGQSPEVVGTSYAKIFAEMYGRADQFAKLMGISTNEWLQVMEKDGIEGYTMYLAALRKLDSESQQKQIKALSGGGRIGVLVTKNVRDVDNALLRYNVGKAEKGMTEGTSALKEQMTVLRTLDAQIFKLNNSWKALGIIAGDTFNEQLAAYVSQLNTALSDPAVISFAKAVGQSFLDIFTAVADGVRWLSALNVNWENFITMAKAMIGVKIAQWILGALSSLPLLGGALTKLGLDAVRAGEQQAAGSAVANTALQNQIARIKALMTQRKAYITAERAQTAAEIAMSKARAAQTLAETKALTANLKVKAANASLAVLGTGITAAKTGIVTAQASAAAAQATVQATLNAKLLAAEAQHQARISAIVAEGEAARNAARAAGSRAGVIQANKDQTTKLAAEETFQARSLRSINAYYAKRLAAVKSAGIAEVGAARLGLMQSFSRFDGLAQSKGFGILTVSARNAAFALNQADIAAKKAAADLVLADAAAKKAALGFGFLSNAVRIAGTAMQALLAIAARLFFWVTIIYLALDAFGLLDNVGRIIQGFTDSLGLTSEASRKVAQAERDRADAMDKARRATEESIKALEKYIDVSTGLIDPALSSKLALNLGDKEDPNVQRDAMNELVGLVESAYAKIDTMQQSSGLLPGLKDKTQKELDDTLAAVAAAETKLQELVSASRTAKGSRFGGLGQQQAQKDLQEEITNLKTLAGMLQQDVAKVGQNAVDATGVSAQKAKKNLEELQTYVKKTMTNESAAAFEQLIPDYVKAAEEQKKANDNFNKASTDYSNANSDDLRAATQAILEDSLVKLQAANAVKEGTERAVGDYIEKMKATGGLSEAVIGSLDALPTFLTNSMPQLLAMLRVVQDIKAAGGQFTGELAPAPKGNPTGTESKDPKGDGKSEARALAKARVELARAGLQAEANLRKQNIDQAQEALEYANSRSLTTIKAFYAEKLLLARRDKEIDIQLKQDEIAAMGAEMKEPDLPKSATTRIEAQIVKAQGELDLLTLQRKALTATNRHEVDDALREFNDKVANQRNSLVEFFGASNDSEAFQVALESAETSYRDFVAKLRTEAEGSPELLKMADMIEIQGKLGAVAAAMDNIGRSAALTSGRFDLLTAKIENMKSTGELTSLQANAAQLTLTAAVIETMEAEQARRVQVLEQTRDITKGLDDQSMKYKELELQVLQGQLAIETLKAKGDEVAKEINTNLKSSLSGLFTDLYSGNGVQEALNNFALNVVNSMGKVAADGLSEVMMQSMGSLGSGGIGGFFSSLFGAGGEGLAKQGTELNPMVTKEWTGDKAAEGAGKVLTAGESMLSTGLDSVTGTLSDVGSSLMGGLSSVTTGIGGALQGGLQMLMGFVGPLLSSIVAAITGSAAADQAQGLVSAAGAAVGAAHGGGIAGRFTMSKNGISLVNPTYYHTGGMVGLQPDEVSAVLRKGEEVLTEDDPRHRNNYGKGEEQGNGQAQNIRIVPVLDPATITEAMQSSQGEQVVVAHITKNASAIRQALKIN